jgi:tRNA threonylcarbamoyladenosine biosynthesis protein TsaE
MDKKQNPTNPITMLQFNRLELDNINRVAEKIADLLPNYACLELRGEMGSGKTTLAMALLHLLGVEHTEGSPTFSLILPYFLPNHRVVYHIDAFRLNSEQEAYQLGFDEIFKEEAFFIVEWPEIIRNFLPEPRLSLTIENSKDHYRNYTLVYGH